MRYILGLTAFTIALSWMFQHNAGVAVGMLIIILLYAVNE